MNRGFSLIESLIAMTIALGLGLSVFQLFRQNEGVFHDEEIITEMQQAARMAAFQIADEIRLAGQGVPLFSASFDESPAEAATVILPGSGVSRINFRAGFSNAESDVISNGLVQLVQGSATSLTIGDASRFASNSGRSVYIWGPLMGDIWGWARASLVTVTTSNSSIQVTPMQTIQFSGAPRVSLEEAVSIYRDGPTNSIRRTAATDLSSPVNLAWAPANELAVNVTALTFTYLDENNVAITPNSLTNRSLIRRIVVNLTVCASPGIHMGSQPSFSVQFSPISANLRNR